jgi:LytS/YehU family sensor histidine kinase
MLDRLNAYLRATLNASRATTHPLQTEFDRLQDYLELIAVRMGPRLHYSLELPIELARLQVPPLLLQPLVENAIKHGLEPMVGGGSMTVRARHHAGQLTLEVLDTGVGLLGDGATLDGFGLTQVRERLATSYGQQASLKLAAGPATGTVVSVTFPCEL